MQPGIGELRLGLDPDNPGPTRRKFDEGLAARLGWSIERCGRCSPVRRIIARAGVGAGTFYRHFPQRSDTAVFRQEVDACAEAAASVADPG
jgi:hypothetical protein